MEKTIKAQAFQLLIRNIVFIFVLLLMLSILPGCDQNKPDLKKENFNTEYQAILLDNGQSFFGKLENADSPYPLLKDIFYIQRMVNKDTNEAKNTLIKRGNEWHGPDRMYINARHIVFIEPVSPGSRVAALIKESEVKGPSTGKQQLN